MTSIHEINGNKIRSNTNSSYGIDQSIISWNRIGWKIIVSIKKLFWAIGLATGLSLLAVLPLAPMVLLLAALPLVLAAVEPQRVKKPRRAASWR
jgi:hypothetical protein